MIGIFPFSGFWAKDEVLHAVDSHESVVIYLLVLASIVITALYMTRLFVRTFLFTPRDRHAQEHAHDAGPVMTVPLLLLAGLTVVAGLVVFDSVGDALGFPGGFGKFVFFEEPEKFKFNWDIAAISTVLAVGGALAGWFIWSEEAQPARRLGQTFRPVYQLLYNRYYIDDIYQFGIDHIVLAAGSLLAWFDRNIVNDTAVDGSAGLGYFTGFGLKFLETGKLPNYALAIATGVVVIAALLLTLKA